MAIFTKRFKLFNVTLLSVSILLSSAAAAASPAVEEEQFSFQTLKITRLTLRDGDSPTVRYYLSNPTKRAPLVLFIQGSGCTPPFVGLNTPNSYSTIYSWLPLASQQRYAVMAVEKPYQSEERQNGEPGSAIGCAGDFNKHFSYEQWLSSLKQAVRHALTRPEVDARRVLVIGISEGASMAAGLARLPKLLTSC